MPKRQAWIDAREDQGLTQLDVAHLLRDDLPQHLKIDPSKLSRFENGRSAVMSPIALAVLARLYKKNLRDIDSSAADELERTETTLDQLRGRGSNSQPIGSNSESAVVSRSRAA